MPYVNVQLGPTRHIDEFSFLRGVRDPPVPSPIIACKIARRLWVNILHPPSRSSRVVRPWKTSGLGIYTNSSCVTPKIKPLSSSWRYSPQLTSVVDLPVRAAKVRQSEEVRSYQIFCSERNSALPCLAINQSNIPRSVHSTIL